MWKVLHWFFLGRVASPFMHVSASLLLSAASLRHREKLSRRDIVPSLALCLTYCAFHLDPNPGHFAFAPWWTVSVVGLREKEGAIFAGGILVGLLFMFSQTTRVMAHVAINLASLSNGKMSTKARALVHFLCALIFARETDGYYADTLAGLSAVVCAFHYTPPDLFSLCMCFTTPLGLLALPLHAMVPRWFRLYKNNHFRMVKHSFFFIVPISLVALHFGHNVYAYASALSFETPPDELS